MLFVWARGTQMAGKVPGVRGMEYPSGNAAFGHKRGKEKAGQPTAKHAAFLG